MADIIQLNQEEIKSQLGDMVRKSVEDTLNTMLDAEADQITQAHKYERTDTRQDPRAGHYTRKLMTKAGQVELKVPKLRKLPFETAIIERYKRREESVEEALIEMYLAGVSVRRVEDISEALWGARVSSGTISNLNQKVYAQIEVWRKDNYHQKHSHQPCAAAQQGTDAFDCGYRSLFCRFSQLRGTFLGGFGGLLCSRFGRMVAVQSWFLCLYCLRRLYSLPGLLDGTGLIFDTGVLVLIRRFDGFRRRFLCLIETGASLLSRADRRCIGAFTNRMIRCRGRINPSVRFQRRINGGYISHSLLDSCSLFLLLMDRQLALPVHIGGAAINDGFLTGIELVAAHQLFAQRQ